LSRKPIKIAGVFEIVDVVMLVFFVGMVPFLGFAFLRVPLWLMFMVVSMPIIAFVWRFRVRRRAGYFYHWVSYRMRPKFWVSGFAQRFRIDDFPSRVPGWPRRRP
jgi:hypothetical protein